MQMNQINLDINKSGQIINEPVVLRVGDKDQTITVNLLKDGQPYTSFTTATFFANKPSGSIVANDPANISNGVITYTVPQALVNEFGKITNAYFLIDGKTSTESFVIAVLQGVNISDDLNDYIPGMNNLNVIYDKWKAKLQTITDELAGIDAPKEVKNVIDNELKNYTDQINELQGRITALKTQLDALEVPVNAVGTNLYTDTRDFDNPSVWSNWSYWNKTGEKYNGLAVMGTSQDWYGLEQAIQAKKGETYTFSAYARYQSGTGKSAIYYTAPKGSAGVNVGTAGTIVSLNETWQRISGTVKVTSDGLLMVRIERSPDNTNTILIAGPKLEKGSIATDYSVNPLDYLGKGDVTNENILPYSGNWSDTTGWTLGAWGASDKTLSIVNHNFYHNGVDALLYIQTVQKNTASARSLDFTLIPSTTYTFSFWGFSSGNVVGTNVYVLGRSYTSTNDYDFTHNLFENLKMSPKGITKYTATFKTGPTETQAYVRLDNTGSNDGKSAGSYFAELKLEQGDIATPYTRVSSSEFSTISQTVDDMQLDISKNFVASKDGAPIYNAVDNTLDFNCYTDQAYLYNDGQTYQFPKNAKITINQPVSGGSSVRFIIKLSTMEMKAIAWNTRIPFGWSELAAIRKTVNNEVLVTANFPITIRGASFKSYATVNAIDAKIKGICHRGFNRVAPEESKAAYLLAKQNGYLHWEGDINWTKDNVPMMIHDLAINRTGRNLDGSEISANTNITDILYKDLADFDFGIVKGERFKGEPLLTFEQLVKLARYNDTFLHIEFKYAFTQEQVQTLHNIVVKYNMLDRIAWQAFGWNWLKPMMELEPNGQYELLGGDVTDDYFTKMAALKTNTNTIVASQSAALSVDDIQKIADKGYPIYLWPVDDGGTVRKFRDIGMVEGIMTNGNINVADELTK